VLPQRRTAQVAAISRAAGSSTGRGPRL